MKQTRIEIERKLGSGGKLTPMVVTLPSEAFAKAAVNDFLIHSDRWVRQQEGSDVWRLENNLFVFVRELLTDNNKPTTSADKLKSEITIQRFQNMLFLLTSGMGTEYYETLFLLDKDGILVYKEVAEMCEMVGVTLEIVINNESEEFTISRHNPEWPWPAIWPEQFLELERFRSFLQPANTNPLDGLRKTRDGAQRTLAFQIDEALRVHADAWARNIVALLSDRVGNPTMLL